MLGCPKAIPALTPAELEDSWKAPGIMIKQLLLRYV